MTTDSRIRRWRLSAAGRTRATIAMLLVGSLALIGLVLVRQAPATPGLQFVQVGHWVYNAAFQSAFHVDGSANQVDARAGVPGAAPGSQVVQGDRSGFVVERSRITVFSKSTLTVENALTPPAPEQPAVLEGPGGPYLVYRNAGQIVRLGDPIATISAGGPLSSPVATSDGTVWLHRIDTGSLCELTKESTRLACHAQMTQGHTGSLAVVDDKPVLVDTTSDTMQPVGTEGFGEPVAVGTDLPPTAQVANSAVGGRLAVVDPDGRRLHLLDTAGLRKGPRAEPVVVPLAEDGRFAGPVTAPHVITLLNQARNELLVYDARGTLKSTTKIPGPDPAAGAQPRLIRGEDGRIYVESPDGAHVLVVNGADGAVGGVKVDGQGPLDTGSRPATEPVPLPQPPPPPPPDPKPPVLSLPLPLPLPEKPRQSAPVVQASVPGAPGGVDASAGDQSATVTWGAAPSNGAPITAYHLSWSGGSTTVDGSAQSAGIDLNNGTSYVITVSAENSAGRGPGVNASVTTPSPPAGTPAIKVSIPANWIGQRPVTLTWPRPDLHGATLVHYVVSVTGQADQTVTEEKAVFGNVMDAQTATVHAVTQFGSGGTLDGAAGTAIIPDVLGNGPKGGGGGVPGAPGIGAPGGASGGFLLLIGPAALAVRRRKE